MSFKFSADEVLQMAERIERNGARFYREAAAREAFRRTQELLLSLAAMEEGHEKAFAEMRSALSAEEREPVVHDPMDEGTLYLRAYADRRIFDAMGDPARDLTGEEREEDILRLGIQAEKDSIVFYTGLKDLVPERLGRDRIDRIIREEMGHFATLTELLAEALL